MVMAQAYDMVVFVDRTTALSVDLSESKAEENSRQQNRRLMKEYMRIARKPIPNVEARPLETNILEWHFVLHGTDGPYAGGKYVINYNWGMKHSTPRVVGVSSFGFRSMFNMFLQICVVYTQISWNARVSSFISNETPGHKNVDPLRYVGGQCMMYCVPCAPVSVIFCTLNFHESACCPSGRFETNTRICLSMSDFHAEMWNPGWNVETILIGLLSFM